MNRDERRESFRKWGTFIVSSLALVLACVRDPIIWTLRATVQEQLHAELARDETFSSANARWEKHRDSGDELIKRLDRDRGVIQEAVAAAHTNQVVLLDLAHRLSLVETNLQMFRQDFQVSQKNERGKKP